MAGPIKLAILADAADATSGVKRFAGDVDSSVSGAADSLGRASRDTQAHSRNMSDGFDKATEGADRSETRAQGFADTLTGVQDAMAGTSAIAKGDLAGGLLQLGTGFADLAGGAAAFLIPAVQKAAGAMKALNLTFLTNPVFLVIAAIVLLVGIFVVAYKRSETFRRIVDGAFRGVLRIARAVWSWLKGNWPLLLAIITGPIGLAVRWVIRHFDSILRKVRGIPRTISGAFRNANTLLVSAGRRIVQGLWSGITGLAGWLRDKVIGFISSTVPGPIARALGLASPSRVARRLARFVPMGLALGLLDRAGDVRKAAGVLAGAALSPPAGVGASLAGGIGAGGGGVQIVFTSGGGDRVMDAIVEELQHRVRIGGGNVQAVLGRG